VNLRASGQSACSEGTPVHAKTAKGAKQREEQQLPEIGTAAMVAFAVYGALTSTSLRPDGRIFT
jgi:hypothetical protein